MRGFLTMEDIAIVGATGAVGQEILRLLEKKNISFKKLRCFASPRSEGKTVEFCNQKITLETLKPGCFSGAFIVFF
ncbi:MAG: hypothetical protein ACHQT8_05080, partial [Chlamydiales bacterium]